ncbi:6-hydroxyhexanoate dehydrogenase [Afipia sp. 1NLS2]|uniref:6-hydroxyhexanoate dehydrogenase n=1 Tax=Afipia sp. 1NLS2 TaxID=666684 RepID=UPI0001D9F07F|nr:6-hydroxyhexanoate dehydrogenase [Afipia sp. 1NLS2]EFI51745.1 Alcohol dehydrogenase GroES domain protein [Afipia sp. 1NLS2]
MALMHRQSLMQFAAPVCETVVDAPVPQGSEVLLRVAKCGLCHSDLHLQDGFFDAGNGQRIDITRGIKLPFTLGHEIVGTVEAAGPDAPRDIIGQPRVVFPWIGCGACRDCINGDENLCARNRYLGVALDGGFASHVLVPDSRYLLPYEPLPAGFAAALMCSGLTAYGAVKRAATHPRRRNLLLIGMGGVGLMGLSIARAMGMETIAVADLSEAARATALDAGAATAYDPAARETARRMLKDSGGGFDVIVDFVGNEASLAFAMSALARGGKIVVSGLMGGSFTTPAVSWVHKRMSIEGFMTGTLLEARELLDLARTGRIAPVPMHEAPMREAAGWMEKLRHGGIIGRIILTNGA